MLLACGQLVLHQTDQLGREWPDVAAERVRRFDQRRVEEVVAAEDERVERSQSGRAERVALGHEPDGAGVAVPERDGADDGRGCDGPARADEPHTKRLADGSSLTGRHAVHLHGREPVLSKRQVILGLPPGGVKERSPRVALASTCSVAIYSLPHRRLMRHVASTQGDEDMVWRYATLVGLALLALTLLVAHAVTAQNSSAGNASKGRDVFLRYCAGCHGEDGRGEAKTFRPNVGNLAVRQLMDELSDDYLFTVIQRGGAAVGKNAAMPAWNAQLRDDEIRDVVAFVRTLSRR